MLLNEGVELKPIDRNILKYICVSNVIKTMLAEALNIDELIPSTSKILSSRDNALSISDYSTETLSTIDYSIDNTPSGDYV